MVRIIWVLVVSLGVLHPAYSCEVCGCSVSGNGIGLLSAYRNNQLGIGWAYASFRAAPEIGTGTRDAFQQANLNLRYHLSERWLVSANAAYSVNQRISEGVRRTHSGWADPSLSVSRVLFDRRPIGKEATLYGEFGTGLRFPIGKYDPALHDKELPRNFNTGYGSFGYFFESRWVFAYRQIGVNLNSRLTLNGPTKNGYRFGDELSANLLIFWQKMLGERSQASPFTGLSLENVGPNTFPNGNAEHGTGGQAVFFTGGFNLEYGYFSLTGIYNHPLSQHYSEGEVLANPRTTVRINYNF